MTPFIAMLLEPCSILVIHRAESHTEQYIQESGWLSMQSGSVQVLTLPLVSVSDGLLLVRERVSATGAGRSDTPTCV